MHHKQQPGNLCFYCVAAFVISASLHSRWTLTLLLPLCSCIVKQRIFVVPYSKSSPTPHTPLKAPQVGAWLACPLSCLKAGCRWKIYDRMPWKPHIPFEVLLFLWWCPCWWRLHWDRSFPHSGGAIQGERGGRVHADMLLYRHSWCGGRFLLAPPLQMRLCSSQQVNTAGKLLQLD